MPTILIKSLRIGLASRYAYTTTNGEETRPRSLVRRPRSTHRRLHQCRRGIRARLLVRLAANKRALLRCFDSPGSSGKVGRLCPMAQMQAAGSRCGMRQPVQQCTMKCRRRLDLRGVTAIRKLDQPNTRDARRRRLSQRGVVAGVRHGYLRHLAAVNEPQLEVSK